MNSKKSRTESHFTLNSSLNRLITMQVNFITKNEISNTRKYFVLQDKTNQIQLYFFLEEYFLLFYVFM